MIEKLTLEQEAKLPIYRDRWINEAIGKDGLDEAQAKKSINWLYGLAGLASPKEIIIKGSPYGCQIEANAQLKNEKPVYITQVDWNLLLDAGWVAFYDFFLNETDITIEESVREKFERYKKLIQSGICYIITFKEACIICGRPIFKKLKRDEQNRLHNPSGPAHVWPDGWCGYYWHGIQVPENYIMESNKITKENLINETNLERRRALYEILGAEQFAQLLDLVEIHRQWDGGDEVILYKTKEKDAVLGDHMYFIRVICPSTGRVYMLQVRPNDNAAKARASTFPMPEGIIFNPDVET